MERVHIHIRPDGVVDRDGIVTPRDTALHYRQADIVVIKIPGHQYWSGRGRQSYAGASFVVYSVERDTLIHDDAGETFWARRIIEFPVRKDS